LIGFSPNAFARGGWSLIAAPGVIRGTIHDRLTVGNCEFEFERQPVVEAFNAWVKAGAAHHGALSTGDLREEIVLLAGMMEIEGALIV
jgi:L-arabinose isomerase